MSLVDEGVDRVSAEGDGVPLEEGSLLPPVERPGKLICIGLNYRGHAEEQGLDPPETPTFFAPTPWRAPGATVPLPPWSRRVDYEAAAAFVIGSLCKDVPGPDALSVVAGYTLLNNSSARDYQFKTPRWMPGKTFDGQSRGGPRW
jgi:acylpyruvate hydrolase